MQHPMSTTGLLYFLFAPRVTQAINVSCWHLRLIARGEIRHLKSRILCYTVSFAKPDKTDAEPTARALRWLQGKISVLQFGVLEKVYGIYGSM